MFSFPLFSGENSDRPRPVQMHSTPLPGSSTQPYPMMSPIVSDTDSASKYPVIDTAEAALFAQRHMLKYPALTTVDTPRLESISPRYPNVSTVSTADLGLTSDDGLCEVQCSTDGMLHLYVWDGRSGTVLHTYKVLTF